MPAASVAMWPASASSASDPDIRPPTISAAMTARVRLRTMTRRRRWPPAAVPGACACPCPIAPPSAHLLPRSVPQRRRPRPDLRQGASSGWRAGSDLDAAVPEPRQRVDFLAVETADMHLEVQVRAGGLAAVAEQGDGVAGADDLADLDQDRVHVAVDGDVAVLVLDVDREAVAARRPCLEHDAVHGRVLGGLHRGREVDAGVQGAPTGAELAGEARSLHREDGLRAGRLGGGPGSRLRRGTGR